MPCHPLEEKLHAKKSIIAATFAATFAVVGLLLGTALGIFSFEEVVVGSHEAQLVGEGADLKYFDENDETHTVHVSGIQEVTKNARRVVVLL